MVGHAVEIVAKKLIKLYHCPCPPIRDCCLEINRTRIKDGPTGRECYGQTDGHSVTISPLQLKIQIFYFVIWPEWSSGMPTPTTPATRPLILEGAEYGPKIVANKAVKWRWKRKIGRRKVEEGLTSGKRRAKERQTTLNDRQKLAEWFKGKNLPKKRKRRSETANAKRNISNTDHCLAVSAWGGPILLCCFIQFIHWNIKLISNKIMSPRQTTSFRQMASEYGLVFFLPYSFLVANQQLYKRLYLSVCRSVCP